MQLVNGFEPHARSPRCDACGGPPGKTVKDDPTSADRQVLDLGIYIDHEGSLNICLTCAEEIGSLVGMLSPEHSAQLEATNRTLVGDADRLEAENAVLENALGAMLRVPSVAKKAPAKKSAAVKKAG